MNTDLARLRALTQDYAQFQARKSGLATTLGGTLALGFLGVYLLLFPLHSVLRLVGVRPSPPVIHYLGGALLFLPFFWLGLKPLFARWLYCELGLVTAKPEADHELRRGRWVFTITAALLAWQTLVLVVLLKGIGEVMASGIQGAGLFLGWNPWLWVAVLPLAYALPSPWLLRGVEEARVYAVLVGQCLLWAVVGFGHNMVRHSPATDLAWGIGFLVVEAGILGWAVLAVRRGRREHREFREILLNLPVGEP